MLGFVARNTAHPIWNSIEPVATMTDSVPLMYSVSNIDTLTKAQAWKTAGGTHVLVPFYWDRLQTTQGGALVGSALIEVKGWLANARAAGLGIIAEINIASTPSWYQTAIPVYKNQAGTTYSDAQQRDAIWSQTARIAIADFIGKVFAAMSPADLAGVVTFRVGGGYENELSLPNSHTNDPSGTQPSYWCYSAAANGTDLATGMTAVTSIQSSTGLSYPYQSTAAGTAGSTNDRAFQAWLTDSVSKYMLFLIKQHRDSGWKGTLHILLPSFGYRAVVTDSDTNNRFELAQGCDWDYHMSQFPDGNVFPWCTWGNRDNNATVNTDADLSPSIYMHQLAVARNLDSFMLCENAAGASDTDMTRMWTDTAKGVVPLGYKGVMWVSWDDLNSGTNGYGTLSNITSLMGSTTNQLAVLTRTNSALKVGGVTKRFSGLNAYWLGLDDNNGGSPGTYPSHAKILASMKGLHEMGASLVRAHTIGISAGTNMSYETAAGTFNDSHLDSADYAVYQAGRKGIRLMVPLTDNWNYYHGGLWNFVHWAYQQNSSGLTDVDGQTKDDHNNRQFFANTTAGLRIRALFKDYISHWLNHINPYTGLAYKDDPTIAIIETGNEIYYAAQLGSNEWTQDIASYIKGIAPNKLVADGSAASGQAASTMPGLTATSVDIIGGHYYPADGSWNPTNFGTSTPNFPAGSGTSQLSSDVSSATGANKAFILGEYPWTRSDVGTWYSNIESNTSISGDMAWAYIANTDSGTPETHGGSFGGDDYAIHRPYNGSNETTYAPALGTHISTISGITKTGGA